MNEDPSRFGLFLGELKRRHVWRAAIAYAAVAFVILQTGEIVLPAFDAPDWALRLVVVLVLLAFPIVMAIAWVYEVTPQGIRRTADMAPGARGAEARINLFARLALLGLTVMIVVGLGWYVVRWTVPAEVAISRGQVSTPRTGSVPASGEVSAIHSLAVLPFENYAEDGQQDWFSAGMHEALIAQLSQIASLRVVSRTTTMRYAGTTMTAPEIGQELNVDAIVEGSVLRAEDRVRITVQLVHAASDWHLWTNSYERDFANVIELQSEVAQAIAREIQAELSPEEETRLAAVTPVSPAVHEAYLRGRFEQSKGTEEGLEAAVRHYQQAIEIDSAYAPAYTGLASAQVMLGMHDPEAVDERLPAAAEAAGHAVILDRDNPDARAILVEVRRQLQEAQGSLEEGLRISVPTLDSLAVTVPSEEWVAAVSDFGRQIELQRLAAERRALAAEAVPSLRIIATAKRLGAYGQHDDAIAILERLVERDPNNPPAWNALERLYAARGDYAGAVAVRRRRVEQAGGGPVELRAVAQLERAVAEQGAQGYWSWRLEQLQGKQERGEEFSHVEYAAAYVGLARYDEALSYLERAFEARDPGLAGLGSDPLWDPLRGDPRFQRLLRRLRASIALPRAPRQP
jgi:TolB-like protein